MMPRYFQHIVYGVDDGVADIMLNRPPLNLIDRDITLEYFAALEMADQDPDVRVIVLSGAGKGLSRRSSGRLSHRRSQAELLIVD